MRASGGRPSCGSSSLGAGEMEALVEAELHGLLERVHLVVALDQEDDDVRLCRLGLDQVGREIGGAERRQVAADPRAAEFFAALISPHSSVWPKA